MLKIRVYNYMLSPAVVYLTIPRITEEKAKMKLRLFGFTGKMLEQALNPKKEAELFYCKPFCYEITKLKKR